jgi:DNA polymerase Ligase (LigD)
MPRFVVLTHDYPAPHWDLLLEAGPVLRCWRLPPTLALKAEVPAEPAADHRLLYLDYEGQVAGDRGTVARVDAGVFEWQLDRADRVVVRLAGDRLAGRLTLVLGSSGWTARLDRG